VGHPEGVEIGPPKAHDGAAGVKQGSSSSSSCISKPSSATSAAGTAGAPGTAGVPGAARNQEAAAQHSANKEARVNNVSSQLDALTRQRGNFSNQTICGCCFPSRGRSCWLTIWGRCFPGAPLRDKQSVDGTIFGCGIVFGRVTFRLRSLYNLQSRAFYHSKQEFFNSAVTSSDLN
jgi:hypothetical protein